MSTLKANSYQHVDRASPSIIINSDGSVSISSTVTYEDITSVDSVGVITGRSNADLQNRVNVGSGVSIKAGGLNVTAGISTFGGTSTFNDDVTFTGAAANVTWDKSTDDLIFNDNAQAKFGTGGDLSIHHDGSRSKITDSGTGDLQIGGSQVGFTNAAHDEWLLKAVADGAVSLYHNNAVRLATTTSGISISDQLNVVGISTLGNDVYIPDKIIHSGDTNTQIRFPANDTISFETAGSEALRISAAGSVGVGTDNPNRKFTLYNDTTTRMNIKSLATSTTGLEFGDPADENIGYIVYDNTDDSMQFGVNTSEALRINSSGQAIFKSDGTASQGSIGIEAGEPFIRLYDTNGTANNRKWDIRNVGAGSYLQFRTVNDANDTFSTKVVITSGGLVGIGEDSPTAELHVGPSGTNTRIRLTNDNTGATANDGFQLSTNAAKNAYVWNWENTNLVFGTNNVHRLTINSTGNAEFTGIVTATNFVPTTIQTGYKNLVINGDMAVAQYGTSSTSNGYSTVDRISVGWGNVDEYPTSAQVDVTADTDPWNLGFRKAFKITNGNQTGGAGAGDDLSFYYKLEGRDLGRSGWDYTSSSSYITLSFWAKSSVAQTFYTGFRIYGTDQREFCFSYALSANTWTKVTKAIPGHSGATIVDTNAIGAFIQWPMWWGTNYTCSGRVVDAWQVKNNSCNYPDMTSTWYTTNDATFEITGIQLEVGSEPTPFEHISYGQQLARCQRYFYKPPINSNLQPAYQYHSGYKMSYVPFPVSMRDTPTSTVTWGTAGTFTHYNPNRDHFKAYVASAYDATEAFYITAFQTTAEI